MAMSSNFFAQRALVKPANENNNADKKKTEEFFNKNKVQETPQKPEQKGTKKEGKKS